MGITAYGILYYGFEILDDDYSDCILPWNVDDKDNDWEWYIAEMLGT